MSVYLAHICCLETRFLRLLWETVRELGEVLAELNRLQIGDDAIPFSGVTFKTLNNGTVVGIVLVTSAGSLDQSSTNSLS